MLNDSFSRLSSCVDSTDSYLSHHLNDCDPISNELMSLQLSSIISNKQLLFPCSMDDLNSFDSTDSASFATVARLRSQRSDSLSP